MFEVVFGQDQQRALGREPALVREALEEGEATALEEGVVELDWDTDWELVEDPEKEVEEEVVAVKLELFVA